MNERNSRWRSLLTLVAVILFLAGFAFALRYLPIASAVEALQSLITRLGIWGPILFALAYILAVILMLPASPLTITAGALFGLAGGFALTSVSSTLGAALTFLIARYLARERVVRWLTRSPRFAAIDRAVSAGGWRIVGLLRLSPAVPFNLQNYLYGITGIGFWPCILTSWIAMIPGTFLYVYLGHIGRTGIEASAGGSRTRTPAEWALLAVGLLATLAVTVYVTRLARQALRETTAGKIEEST